jgi:hypothetical protein
LLKVSASELKGFPTTDDADEEEAVGRGLSKFELGEVVDVEEDVVDAVDAFDMVEQ